MIVGKEAQHLLVVVAEIALEVRRAIERPATCAEDLLIGSKVQQFGVRQDAVEIKDHADANQPYCPLLAFAVASRVSASPYAVPVFSSIQIDCADPWLPRTVTLCPIALSAAAVASGTPFAS